MKRLTVYGSLGALLLISGPALATAPEAATSDGRAVYERQCASCHDGGFSGRMMRAPRIGTDFWSQREAAIGREQLLTHTLRGYGRMAAQGGPGGVTEAEARAALEHLLSPPPP